MVPDEHADIIFIESLISPNRKMLMKSLGMKLRKPFKKNIKRKCNVCRLNARRNIPSLFNKQITDKCQEPDKVLIDNQSVFQSDEIIFDIGDFKSNNVYNLPDMSKFVDNRNCNPSFDKNDTVVQKENIDDTFNDKHNENNHEDSTNLKSLEKNVKDNTLETAEKLFDNDIDILSSFISKKVRCLDKTDLKIKTHEIDDPSKYTAKHSMNSITLEIEDYLVKKSIMQEKSEFEVQPPCIKSVEQPIKICEEKKLFEINTCLKIFDLRVSNLYGEIQVIENNGKYYNNYIQLKGHRLICYYNMRTTVDDKNMPLEDDLYLKEFNVFYTPKHEIPLFGIKIYLVANKKITGVFSELKRFFFKEKRDFIDLSNVLVKNILDLKKGMYKVILVRENVEEIYILPVLEFCINFCGKLCFFRCSNSSSFLRWMFSLLTRVGNPKYFH
ncbi:hypothetical protein CDIK_0729 [Cucumispora dikerogammari]|nr:hypothetical protein CDIK_0729 [Cucumispora dikerogammari]